MGAKYKGTADIFLVVVNFTRRHWMLAAIDVNCLTVTAYNSMQPCKVGTSRLKLVLVGGVHCLHPRRTTEAQRQATPACHVQSDRGPEHQKLLKLKNWFETYVMDASKSRKVRHVGTAPATSNPLMLSWDGVNKHLFDAFHLVQPWQIIGGKVKGVPQQGNDYDCGPYTFSFMEQLSR